MIYEIGTILFLATTSIPNGFIETDKCFIEPNYLKETIKPEFLNRKDCSDGYVKIIYIPTTNNTIAVMKIK